MRHAAEDSKLVPPFAERRSPICESSAVWRRTQNRRVGFGNSRSRVFKS